MSTLDREPRTISITKNGPLFEKRVDPGVNNMNPQRVGPMSPRATMIARGVDHTVAEKRMPVKR